MTRFVPTRRIETVVPFSTLKPPVNASSLEMNLIDDQIVVYPVGSARQVSTIIDPVRRAYNLPGSPGGGVMTLSANLQAEGIVR